MSIVCCITVVALGKKYKRQKARIYNTQQIELETIGSIEITEPMTQTQPEHCRAPNHRRVPPHNESNNNIGSHEAPIPVPNRHLGPYQQQAGQHPLQKPAVNTQKPKRGRQRNTSATLTSFATLPANANVQESTQQGSNVGNSPAYSNVQASFVNPACEFLNNDLGESDYHNIEEPITTSPPPSYNDLFKK